MWEIDRSGRDRLSTPPNQVPASVDLQNDQADLNHFIVSSISSLFFPLLGKYNHVSLVKPA